MRTLLVTAVMALALAPAARADFVDTTWKVTAAHGESGFSDPATLIGHKQSFLDGSAKGAFFTCDLQGLQKTYTTYTAEEFFANREFAAFLPLAEDMKAAGQTFFVHRANCLGIMDPAARATLYPFVTTDQRKKAFLLFGSAVFTLEAE